MKDRDIPRGFRVFTPIDEDWKDARHIEALKMRGRWDKLYDKKLGIITRKEDHLRAIATAEERISQCDDEMADIRAKLAEWGY